MKSWKKFCSALCALAVFVTASATAIPVFAGTVKSDPSFNLIGGAEGDLAVIKDDGTVELDITPTPGFGFRANAAKLGAANLLDVKKFSTVIDLTGVPINVSTMFGLQTVATGTVGGGNGNAINLMFRRDAEDKVAVSVYNAAASEPAYWAPGHLALPDNRCVTISYDYESATPLTIGLKDTVSLPSDLVSKAAFDEHYESAGYKGYYSISSYYFTAPAVKDTTYIVKSINGKTPLENYAKIVGDAADAFTAAVEPLTVNSSDEAIAAAGALDVFGEGSAHSKLLEICDDSNGTIAAKVAAAQTKMATLNQKAEYNEVKSQLTAFKTALEAMTDQSVAAAVEAYEAIDFETLASLTGSYKNELDTMLTQLKANANFAKMAEAMTEAYVKDCEGKVSTGDAGSLSTYRTLNASVAGWAEYKTQNDLSAVLGSAKISAFDGRIAAVGAKLTKSFYSGLWTEGNSWEAIKTDKGLYTTGAGKYYETLGFNQKLELGKDSSITLNLIYALRKLGANHIHIGFYPVTGTGTKGSSDGVRVDFWFSDQGTVEIKPVNGKTETAIYDGAFLSITDPGLFDPDKETPDYEQGRYIVELGKSGTGLTLKVNGLEMDLTGLDASVFASGCYATISAMSVEGAAQNELLVTKLGGTSFQKGGSSEIPGDGDDNKGCGGCGTVGNITSAGIGLGVLLLAGALFVVQNRKKAN